MISTPVRVSSAPGRLVRQQDRGIVDQRAGDGDALTLAAGKLRRDMAGAIGETDGGEHLGRPGATFGDGRAGIDQRQRDIVERGHSGQQIEVGHEADLAHARFGKLVRIQMGYVPPVANVMAGRRRIQAAQQVHQRRLAGTRRPHDRDEGTALDGKLTSTSAWTNSEPIR